MNNQNRYIVCSDGKMFWVFDTKKSKVVTEKLVSEKIANLKAYNLNK